MQSSCVAQAFHFDSQEYTHLTLALSPFHGNHMNLGWWHFSDKGEYRSVTRLWRASLQQHRGEFDRPFIRVVQLLTLVTVTVPRSLPQRWRDAIETEPPTTI